MDKHIIFTKKITESNKFYKNLYNDFSCDSICADSFALLPSIEKGTVQKSVSDLINLTKHRDYDVFFTSGTTGTPLKIYWFNDEYIKSNFYTWYLRKLWYDITPDMKYCTFHSCITNNYNFELINATIINNDRTLSLGRYIYNDEIIRSYISMIKAFGAKWILGPPSVLYIIAKYMIDNKLKLDNILYIELNGEFVDSNMLPIIKRAFGTVKISNLYGSTEFNGIALTCPFGHMHIISNNVYVESIINDGFPCLYITGLVNTAMPFIRYNIGDMGTIEYKKCACGNPNPILNLQNGRINEIMQLKKNIKMDPAAFNNIINEINRNKAIVLRFQVKIISEKSIAFIMLIDYNFYGKIELYKPIIIKKLKSLNSQIDYDVIFVYDEKELFSTKNKFTFIYYD